MDTALINHNFIGQAIREYEFLGYKRIAVPWIVSDEAIKITKPKESFSLEVSLGGRNLGGLVASGEQGFLQLILNGKLKLGKYQTITPCFRDEKEETEITGFWFEKVELIHINPPDRDYYYLVADAISIMQYLGLEVKVAYTDIGLDLYAEGIEVGSYGYRSYNDFSWIYGTGIAEPRFSIAWDRQNTHGK